MATKYNWSPRGTLRRAYINKPDDKYQPVRFKAHLIVDGADAQSLKADIDAAVDEAYVSEMAILTKGLNAAQTKITEKAWSKGYPYEDILDETTGEPTGSTVFKFRQNAEFKLKDGEVKKATIQILNSKGKKVVEPPAIFPGTEGHVAWAWRPAKIAASKIISVGLDFRAFQIRKLAERGDWNFGAAAYEDEDDDFTQSGADDEFGSDDKPAKTNGNHTEDGSADF